LAEEDDDEEPEMNPDDDDDDHDCRARDGFDSDVNVDDDDEEEAAQSVEEEYRPPPPPKVKAARARRFRPSSRTPSPSPSPFPSPPPPPPPPPLPSPPKRRKERSSSHHERRRQHNEKLEREEKLELLSRLQYFIEDRGFKPFRDLGVDDAIEDIRYEVFRAKRDVDKKRNVKMMQKGTVTFAAMVEMANRCSPFKLRLDGYSDNVLMTIHEYDDIFEELHWKYCDSLNVPVEMKFAGALASSMYFRSRRAKRTHSSMFCS
jgi:hypothetical protein